MMADRPLSERATDLPYDADRHPKGPQLWIIAERERQEIATLEAERDRYRDALAEWCVCEEGRPCRFCAVLHMKPRKRHI